MQQHTSHAGWVRRALAVVVAATVVVVPGLTAQRVGGPADQRNGPPRAPLPIAPLTVEEATALVEAATSSLAYVPGEVLVKFRAGTSAAGQTRALSALRSRPASSALRWVGAVAHLRDATERDAERLAAQLRTQPEVEFAQPNYLRPIPRRVAGSRTRAIGIGAAPMRIPNDPSYAALQWNLRLINAPGAWGINANAGTGVVVAVLDTGLTAAVAESTRALWTGQRFEQVTELFAASPDLNATRFVAARDIAFEPGSAPVDRDGHGTHVASTIAEEANNGFGLVGLAYGVRLMPVKVCVGFWDLMLQRAVFGISGYPPPDAGGCADADIIAGIQHAVDSGADVINLSIGGPGEAPALRDAIASAVSRGVFVAAAVGNDFENGNAVDYPSGYAAEIAGFVSVGAVGKSRTRAYYSNTGSHLEIVAPGGSNRDTDGADDAGYVWQVTLRPDDVDPFEQVRPRFDRYGEVGYIGTSMATPHVSAMAALLIAQGVTSPRAIETVLRRTAVDLGPAGRDDQYGHGLIQARTALFGQGLIR